MKKILNRPEDYVDEMLAGLTAAHPQYYRLHGDSGKVVARAQPQHPTIKLHWNYLVKQPGRK